MGDDTRSATGVEEAAAWYARRTSGDFTVGDEAQFQLWMAADSAHGASYARVEAVLAKVSSLHDRAEIGTLKREAAALAHNHRRNRAFMRFAGVGALAAAIAIAVVIGTWMLPVHRMTLQTAPGELRHTIFSDGTQAWLGSDTRIEVAYARGRRMVAVKRGEAFFDVTKNKHRPFVVSGHDRTVTALGTAFDVRVFEPDFVVTLLRGSVAVRRTPAEDAAETRLRPGQQYWLNGGIAVVRDVDAEAQVSWRQGLIELNDTSLGEAVATFNHNSKIKLLIGDDRLSPLRVSGVFHTGKVYDFAHALEVEHPIVAVPQTSGDILLKYH